MVRFDGEAALRALADPRRRRMLEPAWDCERSPSELAGSCELSRSATSQHLRVLREAALVSVRLEKNRRLYRARADKVAELRAMLDEFWGSWLATLRAEWRTARRRPGRDRRRCGDPRARPAGPG